MPKPVLRYAEGPDSSALDPALQGYHEKSCFLAKISALSSDASSFGLWAFVIHSGIRVSSLIRHSSFGIVVGVGYPMKCPNPNAETMTKPESPNE
jgi:hypothetical protein